MHLLIMIIVDIFLLGRSVTFDYFTSDFAVVGVAYESIGDLSSVVHSTY